MEKGNEFSEWREMPSMSVLKDFRNFLASHRVYEWNFPGRHFSVIDICGLEARVVEAVRMGKWAYPVINEFKREIYKDKNKIFLVIQSIFVMRSGDKGMILELDDNDIRIIYDPSDELIAKKMIRKLSKYKRRIDVRNHIHMVVPGDGELVTEAIPIKATHLNVNALNNDDFLPFHDSCMERLAVNDKALFLMHGAPGTGKSTYIKFLLGRLGKKVIYLSTQVAASLDSPTFSRFLMEQARDAILIIEDAELLLTSRDSDGNNSAISLILNLSDGLLADSLAVKIICTFNTDVRKLDRALLRKGRLTGMYEFKPLVAHKSDDLLRSMGREEEARARALTLAEIFHMEECDNTGLSMARPEIGFRTAS